jgi:hypothetical protein
LAAIAIGLGVLFLTGPAASQSSGQSSAIEHSGSDKSLVSHPKELVELFTSQGCSSCPPADKFIASLADSPTTLALSFNVTYWDYLGWRDPFAQREFTRRQKDYAKSLGVGNVYTPQIVVNGSAHSNRFTRSQIMAASLPDNRPVFDLTTADSALYVKSSGETDMAGSNLTVIAYKPGLQKTPVSRGENRRRTLENYNVVTGVYPVNAETSYRLDLTGHEAGLAYALLASDPVTSEVLSITQIRPE